MMVRELSLSVSPMTVVYHELEVLHFRDLRQCTVSLEHITDNGSAIELGPGSSQSSSSLSVARPG